MLLTKLEIARRHIDFAIQCLFENRDPVPLHTVVGAAHNVAHDLVVFEGKSSSWVSKVAEDNGIAIEKALAIFRKTQNVFKHARKDANEAIDYNVIELDYLLMSTAFDLQSLNNEGELNSLEVLVFQLWFIAVYVNDFMNEDFKIIVDEANSMFPNIRALSRDHQLNVGLTKLVEIKSEAT